MSGPQTPQQRWIYRCFMLTSRGLPPDPPMPKKPEADVIPLDRKESA